MEDREAQAVIFCIATDLDEFNDRVITQCR